MVAKLTIFVLLGLIRGECTCWSNARSQLQEPELEFWRNIAIGMIKKCWMTMKILLLCWKGPGGL